MKRRKKILIAITAGAVAVFAAYLPVWAQGGADASTGYKRIKSPGAFGSTLIDKNTRANKAVKPVVFPHWPHRTAYSCKACHTDLGFGFASGSVDIKHADLEKGKYCGACHDGKASFDLKQCDRCHNYGSKGEITSKRIEDALKDLPADDFGNKVNWVKALRDGKIKASATTSGSGEMLPLDMDVEMAVTKFIPHPPDVLFPHKAHTEQMICTACHTGIDNPAGMFFPKKGANPEMDMIKIISGQYCGACHGKVAFPLEDCFRCHSMPPPKPPEPPKKEEPKKEEGKPGEVKKDEAAKDKDGKVGEATKGETKKDGGAKDGVKKDEAPKDAPKPAAPEQK